MTDMPELENCPFCKQRFNWNKSSDIGDMNAIGGCSNLKCILGDLHVSALAWNTRADTVQAGEWLPIDSAPRDGTPILITVPPLTGSICIYVAWNKDGKWIVFDSGHGHRASVDATHWMPLPESPKEPS